MSDKDMFLDTNILVCDYSTAEPEKCEVARHLITSGRAWISVQVLNKYCNVTRRKYPLLFERVSQALDELADFLNIVSMRTTPTCCPMPPWSVPQDVQRHVLCGLACL